MGFGVDDVEGDEVGGSGDGVVVVVIGCGIAFDGCGGGISFKLRHLTSFLVTFSSHPQ